MDKKDQKKETEKKLNLKELKESLEKCEKQKSEYLAGWQRAKADFLNYKKDERKRFEDFLGYAKEEFILKILPILDNFELASKQKLDASSDIQGFLNIKKQLENFLKNQGVEKIKSLGEKFNPHFHEAVEQVSQKESEQITEPEIVVEEMQKGYTINGRLLRPAKVKVSK